MKERKEEREIGRTRERDREKVDLVDWKENCLFNKLIMQNLYIVN